MSILVVLAHPKPGSFNHALARSVCEALRNGGRAVTFHDLYAERFDPVLPSEEIPRHAKLPADVRGFCDELARAEGIVIVHPNWWGQPPAILKGWVDRVFRAGVAYRFDEDDSGEGVPVGLLRAGAAVVLNTSNTPAPREQSVFGDPLEVLWKRCIFGLCGVHTVHRRTFGVMVTSTADERAEWLVEAQELVLRAFRRT